MTSKIQPTGAPQPPAEHPQTSPDGKSPLLASRNLPGLRVSVPSVKITVNVELSQGTELAATNISLTAEQFKLASSSDVLSRPLTATRKITDKTKKTLNAPNSARDHKSKQPEISRTNSNSHSSNSGSHSPSLSPSPSATPTAAPATPTAASASSGTKPPSTPPSWGSKIYNATADFPMKMPNA